MPYGRGLVRRTVLRSFPPASGVPVQRQTPVSGPSGPVPDVDVTPVLTEPRKATGRHQVTPEEREAKRIVKARSGGWCETGCGRRVQSWSHRVARSQGGPWDPVNGLHLCSLGSGDSGCHTWTGRRIALACEGGWRLRSWQDPASEPVWLAPSNPPRPAGWYVLTPDGGLEAVNLARPRPVMPWEVR